MFFFPFRTDAPIYHFPYATIVLIVLNCLVYMVTLTLIESGEATPLYLSLCLNFGTINPLQWLSNIFMHADLMHLIGNMIFLWTFGLIVEGKLGWYLFVPIYLFIGVLESAFVQLLMLPAGDGFALGASGAIFGLLAISLLWAPKNELGVFAFILYRAAVFDVPVSAFAGFCLICECFKEGIQFALSEDGSIESLMSSAFLHLFGALIGGVVGYVLLSMRLVDCEGYDLLSVISGKEGQKVLTRQQEAEQAQLREEKAQKVIEERKKAATFIKTYLDQGQPDYAIGRFKSLKALSPLEQWDPQLLHQLINVLLKQQRWEDAMEYLKMFIRLQPEKSAPMTLVMAQVLISRLERPSKGKKLLSTIDTAKFNEKQLATIKSLNEKADKMIEDGVIDFVD